MPGALPESAFCRHSFRARIRTFPEDPAGYRKAAEIHRMREAPAVPAACRPRRITHGKGPSAQRQRPSAAETEPPAASAGGKKGNMHRKTDMSAWSTRKTARLRAMRTQKKKKLGHRGRPCPRTLHNRTGWQRHAYLFMTSRRPSPQSGLRTREWRGLSRARHERNFSRQAGTCRRMQRQIKSKFEFELLSLFCQGKKCLFCFHSTFFPGQTPCPP